MTIVSALFLGLSDHDRAVAEGAVRAINPAATMATAARLSEAVSQPETDGTQLLVVGVLEPDPTPLALAERDRRGLARWAVIALASSTAGTTGVTVPPGLWTETTALVLIPLAAQVRQLARENQLLRGDLATVGRRVSHDLRAPLSAIVSSTEVIRDSLESKDPESLVFTHTITDAVNEQERLIRRVSALLKASAQPEPAQTVPMLEPVRAAVERNEFRAHKQGATFIIAPEWPLVSGVAAWLELIWSELIANALDHAGVPQPRVELGWTRRDGRVRFWVSSAGKGVPPEKRHALFYPFDLLHRLDAPRGLGLPIVERLVDLQSGTYGLEPTDDGARFYFSIPEATTG